MCRYFVSGKFFERFAYFEIISEKSSIKKLKKRSHICAAGFLPSECSEEHDVHVSQGQKLSGEQTHPQPLPVLQAAEVLRTGHVQGG